ncbi:hypothetical protein CR513_33447, partial [Mucuna pruriens]
EAAGKTIPHLIKDLILKYRITLLALLETRINGVKADKVIKNLGMDSWYKVDAQGFFGGPRFTWEGKGVKERIDCELANRCFFSRYGHANVWAKVVSKFYENGDIWNKACFGNLFHQKRQILAKLEDRGENRYLQHRKKNLWQEYESIISQEELCEWIQFGDLNTRFYHISTIMQRKKNKIEALLDQRGEMILDQEVLKDMTKNHFQDLYKEESEYSPWQLNNIFPLMKLRNHSLIMKFDHHCYYESDRIQEINSTLLVLIPKCDASTFLYQFRPFSLCNVKKFMPMLVGPNQCSFVPGRHAIDNVVIA